MHVFLIPIGAEEYEPYFEPPDEPEDPVAPTGWFDRQRHRLREMLREAEAERNRRHARAAEEVDTLTTRFRRKTMRWIVERAAEQRLLWHLRTAPAAVLTTPDDLDAAAALAVLRKGLKRDGDRHFRWLVVNALGLVGSIALIIVPGPNVVGYYFVFTTVGHLLSWRGARHGLQSTAWEVRPNAQVASLRAALTMAPTAREAHVHHVAGELGLQHLATFFERLVLPTA